MAELVDCMVVDCKVVVVDCMVELADCCMVVVVDCIVELADCIVEVVDCMVILVDWMVVVVDCIMVELVDEVVMLCIVDVEDGVTDDDEVAGTVTLHTTTVFNVAPSICISRSSPMSTSV